MGIKYHLRGGNLLTLLTVVGVAIGVGLGVGLRNAEEEAWSKRRAMYLRLPGDLFLRALQCLMLPLIFSSFVSATGTMDLRLSKRIGLRALIYYVSTSAIAGILGTLLVHFIAPGKRAMEEDSTCGEPAPGSTVDTLLDILRNLIPSNIIGATVQYTKTTITLDPNNSKPFEELDFSVQIQNGTNMLGVITFALILGITLATLGREAKLLINIFTILTNAMLKLAMKLIWFGPLAVIFLISGTLVQADLERAFKTLGWYTGVMVGSYLLHGFVALPIIFTIFTRKLPFRFTANISEAIFTAFGTASSTATLPVTLKCLEENHKMDTRLTRFLLPIGATVNMDGAAIGVPLRVIYIAQLCGRSLGFGDLLSIALTSLAASVGTAGIPGAAMIVTVNILESMGLPTTHIAYVLAVDWLQDRVGTVVNVVGDAYVAAVIGHLSKKDLKKVDKEMIDEGVNIPEMKSTFTKAEDE